jgi:hypothetical protein
VKLITAEANMMTKRNNYLLNLSDEEMLGGKMTGAWQKQH